MAQTCPTYQPTNLVPIGEATGALLTKAGGRIAYTPSRALAKVLAAELPPVEGKEVGGWVGGRFGGGGVVGSTSQCGRERISTSAYCTTHASPTVHIYKGPTRVLYPASKKAQKTLEDGLAARVGADGKPLFEVVRLNTYDTVPAEWGEAEAVGGGWLGCSIVCGVGCGAEFIAVMDPPRYQLIACLTLISFLTTGHMYVQRRLGPARARW